MPQVSEPAVDLRAGPLGTGALLLQMLWGIFIAAWNLRGVALLGQHQAPLGPDSSMNAALIAIGLLVGLLVTAKRSPVAYGLVSLAILGFAGWTAATELAADAAVWASSGWRTATIGLNAVGVLGSALGLVNAIRHWRSR
jgi:hypothetical protein